jgi:hypothetical protein
MSAKKRYLSFHHSVQTGCGAHPASYSIGATLSFPEIKRLECEIDHSPATIADVKNEWIYASTPQYAFMF